MRAVDKVLSHGQIVLGPEVRQFEGRIARFCGVTYAVGVNSGSDALYFALRALGIGPGDQVITSCLSFVATANAISMTGAQPVFVDIRDDFNIDPQKIIKAINPRTKAIVPVHFTGKMCAMKAIMSIARQYKLKVVEDAAQAFGASISAKKAGSWGHVSALSMNPMKVLAACGEAGAVISNDVHIKKTVEALRYNGAPSVIDAHYVSLNGRLDTIQAAILLERLKHFNKDIQRRRRAARYYSQALHDMVIVPSEQKGEVHVYYTYNIHCSKRDQLKRFLTAKGIETKVHHPLLMPEQKAYKGQVKGQWPMARKIVSSSLCLPISEKVTKKEQDYVIDCIRKFYKH